MLFAAQAASVDRRVSLWRADWDQDTCELIDWLTFAAPTFVGGQGEKEPGTLARFTPANLDIIVITCFGPEPQLLFHSLSLRKVIRKTQLSSWVHLRPITAHSSRHVCLLFL